MLKIFSIFAKKTVASMINKVEVLQTITPVAVQPLDSINNTVTVKENINMSFLSKLHSFGAWTEKELALIVGKTPAVETVAASILKYAGPALQIVVSAECGAPAGALVGKVLGDAQAGLTAASGLIYDFGANPTASSVVASVQTNLSSLLVAGHITNPTSVATVTKVSDELSSLVTVLNGTTAATPVV